MGTAHYQLKPLLVLGLLSLMLSCSPTGNKINGDLEGWTVPALFQWEFDSPADYTYDSDYIDVTGGVAVLQSVRTQHTAESDFTAGTFVGTTWDTSTQRLTLADDAPGARKVTDILSGHSDSLVGYWMLDNGVLDSSGNGYNATVVGGSTFVTTAKVGTHAIDFGGNANYLDISAIAGSGVEFSDGSICMWIYRQFGDDDRELFRLYADANNSIILRNDGATGQMRYEIRGGGTLSSNSALKSKFPTDEWTHVCATWDATGADTARLFVNGEVVALRLGIPTVVGTLTSALVSGEGTASFLGRIDEVAIWSSILSVSEVGAAYHIQKQRYGGFFESKIIDVGTEADWTTLAVSTPLPFGKELPSTANSEEATSYSDIGANLMDNLHGYWPLNGHVLDESGSSNDIVVSGDTAYAPGVIGKGIENSPTGDVLIPGYLATDLADVITASFWTKAQPSDYDGVGDNVFHVETFTDSGWAIVLDGTGTSVELRVVTTDTGIAQPAVVIPSDGSTVIDGTWHHIAFVIVKNTGDSTMSTAELFIDGQLVETGTYDHLDGFGSASDIKLGDADDGGRFDEVAIWARALTPGEILQVYRRGANRIKYQVRTCVDPDCSDAVWLGPNGSSTTYFTELHNRFSIDSGGNGAGTLNLTPLSLTFADFSSAGLTVLDNRYFQYRVIMESESADDTCENSLGAPIPCFPELQSVVVGPSNRIYGGSPKIGNATGIPFYSIDSVSFVEGSSCSPTYQVSNDGSTFYYWTDDMWVAAADSDPTQSNSGTVLNANIKKFSKQIGTGSFYWRALLNTNSEMDAACELDSVSVMAAE